MKILAAAVAFLLLTASFSLVLASPHIHNGPCCVKHTRKRIPKRLVKSYYYTGGNCSLPSIVLVFHRKLSACVDPNDQWVQDLMKALNEK